MIYWFNVEIQLMEKSECKYDFRKIIFIDSQFIDFY
jgi:hypothetical protein